jgi:hypothetical protein
MDPIVVERRSTPETSSAAIAPRATDARTAPCRWRSSSRPSAMVSASRRGPAGSSVSAIGTRPSAAVLERLARNLEAHVRAPGLAGDPDPPDRDLDRQRLALRQRQRADHAVIGGGAAGQQRSRCRQRCHRRVHGGRDRR